MAPYVPEEVDVFSVPHSRMKELVSSYFALVKSTNFSSTVDMQLLLDSLYRTFTEFKSHEQIENKLIMRKLRSKMRNNEAVCDCHKESRLTEMTEMLQLLQDGFSKSTVQDRVNYGLQLTKELEEFTSLFLPHMQEEEEVFQPLLLEHFSYDELCALRLRVIELHRKRQEQEKFTWTECEKECSSSLSESDDDEHTEAVTASPGIEKTVEYLPSELLLNIFGRLTVQDLCRCAQVCRLWNRLAKQKVLWTDVLPTQWAQDTLVADYELYSQAYSRTVRTMDADADVDEAATCSDVNSRLLSLCQREKRILRGCIDSLLPSVGHFVQKIVIRNSLVLDDRMLRDMLALCSNVEYLDLSYCNISDKGLISVRMSDLTTLIVAGCENVTDTFLLTCFLPDNMPVGAVWKSASAAGICQTTNCWNAASGDSLCSNLNQRDSAAASTFCHVYAADVCREELCSSMTLSCAQKCNVDDSVRCTDRSALLSLNAVYSLSHSTVVPVGGTGQECQQSTVGCAIPDQSGVKHCCRKTHNNRNRTTTSYKLEHLDISGCWKITDLSIRALSQKAYFPRLRHLDMSGCFHLTGDALKSLVSVCPALQPSSLYYCDNITDGPFPGNASGCRNLQCTTRVCCRSGD